MKSIFVIACAALLVASISAASVPGVPTSINNQLYRRYVCVDKSDGFRALVPGSCSQYYECQGGQALVSTCSRFFDAKVQGCVNYNTGCIAVQSSALVTEDVDSACTPTPCPTTTVSPCVTTPSAPTTCSTTTCSTTTCSTTTCSTTTCSTTTTTTCSPETTTSCDETTTVCGETTTTCSGASAAVKVKPASMQVRPPRPTRPAGLLMEAMQQQVAPQAQELNIFTYTHYVCRNKPDGFMMASLKSCNDYYICRYGKPLQVSCGDKYFNALKGICDLPENTRCVQPSA
ncbi:keratin-associated protein 10-6 isoform X2 [Drosophila obscura]|uniref:keratin-associated protein 10-6 isoform X2 n=1 Tax=Drosophila obscura TaxID=7282 RepID=UPI001BB1541B|nr:keratin-associated protein 10-6 isoform X2 [Drosophila obscura]